MFPLVLHAEPVVLKPFRFAGLCRRRHPGPWEAAGLSLSGTPFRATLPFPWEHWRSVHKFSFGEKKTWMGFMMLRIHGFLLYNQIEFTKGICVNVMTYSISAYQQWIHGFIPP